MTEKEAEKMDEVKDALDKMEALMRAKLLARGLYIRAFGHVLKEAKAEVLAEVEQKEETEDGKNDIRDDLGHA
jgi:hypothetical protein